MRDEDEDEGGDEDGSEGVILSCLRGLDVWLTDRQTDGNLWL